MNPFAQAAFVLALAAAMLNLITAVISFLEKNVFATRAVQPAFFKKI
jgi:hypothetical protein